MFTSVRPTSLRATARFLSAVALLTSVQSALGKQCRPKEQQRLPEALDDERRERLASVRVLGAVRWSNEELLPYLEIRDRAASATVHPTCSTRHLELAGALEALAFALADDVFVAIEATCCGMAGDRGLLHPELTAAATADQAAEVAGRAFDAYLSANRTCEIALEQATDRPYESVVQLLERATRP